MFVLIRYFGGISCKSYDLVVPPMKLKATTTDVPTPSSALHGCLLAFKTRIIFWDFVLVMVTETLMLALLIIKALQHCEDLLSLVLNSINF